MGIFGGSEAEGHRGCRSFSNFFISDFTLGIHSISVSFVSSFFSLDLVLSSSRYRLLIFFWSSLIDNQESRHREDDEDRPSCLESLLPEQSAAVPEADGGPAPAGVVLTSDTDTLMFVASRGTGKSSAPLGIWYWAKEASKGATATRPRPASFNWLLCFKIAVNSSPVMAGGSRSVEEPLSRFDCLGAQSKAVEVCIFRRPWGDLEPVTLLRRRSTRVCARPRSHSESVFDGISLHFLVVLGFFAKTEVGLVEIGSTPSGAFLALASELETVSCDGLTGAEAPSPRRSTSRKKRGR